MIRQLFKCRSEIEKKGKQYDTEWFCNRAGSVIVPKTLKIRIDSNELIGKNQNTESAKWKILYN